MSARRCWTGVALGCALLAGCSLFSRADTGGKAESKNVFADGMLKAIGALAPANSVSQFLARIADDQGWESQITENAPLKKAVEAREFDTVVVPFLLSLYYRNGFSVLPRVGEGHQFSRDSIVRGVAGTTRLLVTTRAPVKLIFLAAVDNVQIVYPQDGQEPQVFTLSGAGTLTVRKSRLEQYLQ